MTTHALATEVTCAVEVFLVTALLHREQQGRHDFLIQEIVQRAVQENIAGLIRSGVSVHASQHCVANRPPNPSKLRMLFATGKHTRRLLQKGDQAHPERSGKIFPDPDDVPAEYLPLLDWAKRRYESGAGIAGRETPVKPGKEKNAEQWLESLFELEGLGAKHWKDVDPDQFVRQLREGWE